MPMGSAATGPVPGMDIPPSVPPLGRPLPSPAQIAHRREFGKVWGKVGADYRRDRLAAGR